MLVLRRKAGEAVVLNGVIKIAVLAVEGDRVKLGFEAPLDVIIVRQELLDEHRQAAEGFKRYCIGIADALLGLGFSVFGMRYHIDVISLGHQQVRLAYAR